MEKSRYSDRERYFNELYLTSKKYYIEYVGRFKPIEPGLDVLEIGCGEGGNLLPFAEIGCNVYGLDIAEGKIGNAQIFFGKHGVSGQFRSCNFLENRDPFGKMKFDVIIIHDVIEHIEPTWKQLFFDNVCYLLADDGIAFWGFPDWYMPFGGHQQVCRSKVCSHLPFAHILPSGLYKSYLNMFGEDRAVVEELLSIKRSKMTSKSFESYAERSGLSVADRVLWLINPHYEIKFRLKPRRLPAFVSYLPVLRDLMSTSCHYVTVKKV